MAWQRQQKSDPQSQNGSHSSSQAQSEEAPKPLNMAATAAGWDIQPSDHPDKLGISVYADVGKPTLGSMVPSHHSQQMPSLTATDYVEKPPAPPSKSARNNRRVRAKASTDRLKTSQGLVTPSISSGASSTALSQSRSDLSQVSSSMPESSSKLEISGGAAGLFGAPTTNGKLKKFGIPWRQRSTSTSGTSLFRSRGSSLSTSDEREPDATPRRASSNLPAPMPSISSSSSAPPPIPRARKPPAIDPSSFGDDAEAYVEQVVSQVPRADVPAVLASNGDDFHKEALRLYMQRFLFVGNPMDVALRKMLMSLSLPKETQQIDRVMEAFARRYNECNEGVFDNDDQPYVLAFSLMMLHTDAFNRNAKQKMSKTDYIRNTSSSNVPTEILEYLYDNLTFTEFIHVEDDESTFPGNKRKVSAGSTDVGSSLRNAMTPSASLLTKSRVDPYYIIATGQTHTFRAHISLMIPEESPFSHKGSLPAYDFEALHRAFVHAPCIEIVTAVQPQPTATAAGAMAGNFATSTGLPGEDEEKIVTLRVTKVGCVSRKDDVVDENKKATSRKWRTCGMILSSSQLLFFKDLVWTSALDQQIVEQTGGAAVPHESTIISPRITYFKPDGVLALSDAVAVKDISSAKYKHVLRLFAKQGDISRQYLIQTTSEADMNDWIHKINFCSAFRSTRIRIRGLDPPLAMPNNQNGRASFSSVRSWSERVSTPPLTSSSRTGLNGESNFVTQNQRVARRQEIESTVSRLEANLEFCEKTLTEKLRLARHLSILTPFMKFTRDRIEANAVPLALQIRQLRLDMARSASRRELLLREVEACDRDVQSSGPPSTYDAPDLALRSGWSASSVSLSHSPMSPNGGERSSSHAGSLEGSRKSSLSQIRRDSGAQLGGGMYLELPVQPRLSMSDAGSSRYGSASPSLTAPPAAIAEAKEERSGFGKETPTLRNLSLHSSSPPQLPPATGLPSSMALSVDFSGGEGRDMASGLGLSGYPSGDDNDEEDDDVVSTRGLAIEPPLLDSKGLLLSPKDRQAARDSPTLWTSPLASGRSAFSPVGSPYMRPSTASPASPTLHSPREEAEPWNRSRVARDAKRISLVTLPEVHDWQDLASKRSSLRIVNGTISPTPR